MGQKQRQSCSSQKVGHISSTFGNYHSGGIAVFGVDLPNIQLLADEYAKRNFYALVPDVFKGDPIPYEFLDTVEVGLLIVISDCGAYMSSTPEILTSTEWRSY